MKIGFCVLTACSALLLTASLTFAHHFFPRESDTTVSIVGTVVKFEMVNPHSRVLLDVRDAQGTISRWEIELGSVQSLIGRGWDRTSLKPGDVVTLEATVGKGRANVAAAHNVALPDGRTLFGGSHAGDYPRR